MRLANPLLLLSIFAFFQAAETAPSQEVSAASLHGIPISYDPGHHLVLSNDYTNAYDVEVAPHRATLLHQHLYDSLFVVLDDADVTNSVEGKAPAELKLPESSISFGHAPYAHVVKNKGTQPYRNVIIEFIQPQGEVKNFYPSVAEALAAAAVDEHGMKQKTVLEGEAVRVLGVAIPVSGTWIAPSDGQPRLVVLLDQESTKEKHRTNDSESPAGTLVWLDENNEGGGLANTSDQPLRLMVVEFKTSGANALLRL